MLTTLESAAQTFNIEVAIISEEAAVGLVLVKMLRGKGWMVLERGGGLGSGWPSYSTSSQDM